MDYFSFSSNGVQGDSQPADLADVPHLDRDSSTVPSSSPSTTHSGPAGPGLPSLDPQAPSFDFGRPPVLSDWPFTWGTLPSYEQPFQCGTTTNDELKWMLTAMASRLDVLELAVSTENMQVAEILKQLKAAEDMVRAVEDLKKSLKDLFKSFVFHCLGGEGADGAEMRLSHPE